MDKSIKLSTKEAERISYYLNSLIEEVGFRLTKRTISEVEELICLLQGFEIENEYNGL